MPTAHASIHIFPWLLLKESTSSTYVRGTAREMERPMISSALLRWFDGATIPSHLGRSLHTTFPSMAATCFRTSTQEAAQALYFQI